MCELIFQKQNCYHTIFSLDVSKFHIPSLSASAERSQISQHNGTNNVNCTADWDHQQKILTLRTRFGKQFLLVTSSKPACRCLLFPLLHAKRWKRENLSACNKGNWRCEPRLPWVAMVGKIQRIKDNIPIIYILSFRHFLVKNKLFYWKLSL